jgi:hypothetical protein
MKHSALLLAFCLLISCQQADKTQQSNSRKPIMVTPSAIIEKTNSINTTYVTYSLKPSWVVLDPLEEQKRKDSLVVLNRRNKALINTLTLDFFPSFTEKFQVSIEKHKDGYTLTITSETIRDRCQLTESSMADLNHFLVDYLPKKFTIDSLETVRKREMEKKGQGELRLDGTTINGVLDGKSFTLGDAKRGTIDHTFMWILFRLMNASFKNPATIVFIEQQEGNSHGLGLKKLNENPLTYRWYGSITSDEAKELHDFIEQLPTNKEIIFDMSIFKAMGSVYYDSFKALCTRIPTIKWINCTDRAKKQLMEAGINPSSIK